MLVCLMATMYFAVNMVLDAAIREQDFNDAIRHARCERMNEHTRAYMKGYCQ
jgi:hypothetical protein